MSDTGVARLTAERIALELFGKGIVPSDAHAHAAKLIAEAHLAPILARNAAMEAVLRECRFYVAVHGLAPTLAGSTVNNDLLARIDQLTAKGADNA